MDEGRLRKFVTYGFVAVVVVLLVGGYFLQSFTSWRVVGEPSAFVNLADIGYTPPNMSWYSKTMVVGGSYPAFEGNNGTLHAYYEEADSDRIDSPRMRNFSNPFLPSEEFLQQAHEEYTRLYRSLVSKPDRELFIYKEKIQDLQALCERVEQDCPEAGEELCEHYRRNCPMNVSKEAREITYLRGNTLLLGFSYYFMLGRAVHVTEETEFASEGKVKENVKLAGFSLKAPFNAYHNYFVECQQNPSTSGRTCFQNISKRLERGSESIMGQVQPLEGENNVYRNLVKEYKAIYNATAIPHTKYASSLLAYVVTSCNNQIQSDGVFGPENIEETAENMSVSTQEFTHHDRMRLCLTYIERDSTMLFLPEFQPFIRQDILKQVDNDSRRIESS